MTRFALALLTAGALAGTAAADPIVIFEYTFSSGTTVTNPGPFSPTSASPATAPLPYPTLTATTAGTPASVTIGAFNRPTNANVALTAGGLGIRTDGFSVANIGFGPFVVTLNEANGLLGGAVVDGVGLAVAATNALASEALTLVYSNSNPNLTNALLTAVTFNNYLNPGNAPDIDILLNGTSVSGGVGFDLPGLFGPGTLTLPTAIPLSDGDQLTFRPIDGALNFFSIQGAQIQATVVPEPATLAVFAGLAGVGGLFARRRRKTAA